MNKKEFDEFVQQHYHTIRSKECGGGWRRKDSGLETDPIIILGPKKKSKPCSRCDRILTEAEKSTITIKKNLQVEHCSNCRRFKHKESGKWVYQSELTPKGPGRPRKIEVIEPEVVPEPIQEPQIDHQLPTTETVTTYHNATGFVERVTVRDYHESVITEYSRTPVCPQHQQCDAQDSDSEVRKD